MSKEDVNVLAQAILDRFFAKGSIVSKDDWDFLVAKLSPLLSQAPVTNLRESLAGLEHEQWIAWSRDIAATEKITPARLARWSKLWRPYAELTEAEKDQDREWADKALLMMQAPDREQKVECRHTIQTAKWVCDCGTIFDNMQGLALEALSKAPVEEQKEGVGCCDLCRATFHEGHWTCNNHTCPCHTPTPTVKEESHTQGWIDEINRLVRDFTTAGYLSKSLVRQELEKFYERALRENPAIEHCSEPDCPECNKAAFEAGRLQGIAEERQRAIDFADHEQRKFLDGFAHPDKCDECRTALSSLTHKE